MDDARNEANKQGKKKKKKKKTKGWRVEGRGEKREVGEERSFSLITGERRSGIKENQISASDGEKRIGHRVRASAVWRRGVTGVVTQVHVARRGKRMLGGKVVGNEGRGCLVSRRQGVECRRGLRY